MSLTTELKNPDSPLATFMAKIINDESAKKMLAVWNNRLADKPALKVRGVKDPALVGTAFDYAFRWHVAGEAFQVKQTVAYIGAEALTARDDRSHCDILSKLVALGNERTHLKPAICIVLAWYEQIYRAGGIPVPIATAMSYNLLGKSLIAQVPKPESEDVKQLTDTIDWVWATLMSSEQSILLEFDSNPVIPNAEYVGGADADWIWGGTLYDCKCSWKRHPFTDMHLKQVGAYALLDWDNKLELRGLGWYYARQRMIIEYPIHKLISDLADKRQALKDLLTTETTQPKKPLLSIAAFLDDPSRDAGSVHFPDRW